MEDTKYNNLERKIGFGCKTLALAGVLFAGSVFGEEAKPNPMSMIREYNQEKEQEKSRVAGMIKDYNKEKQQEESGFVKRLREYKRNSEEEKKISSGIDKGAYRPLGIEEEWEKPKAGSLNESESLEMEAVKKYYEGDITVLEALYDKRVETDPKNESEVNDNIAYLIIAHYLSHGKRDIAVEKARKFKKRHGNSELFGAVSYMINTDPLIYSKAALRKETVNKIFGFFDALQDLALSCVIGGGKDAYVDAAVTAGFKIYQMYEDSKRIGYNEKQALYALLDFARSHPDHHELSNLKGKIEKLIRKSDETVAEEEYDKAKALLKRADKPEEARNSEALWNHAAMMFRFIEFELPETRHAKKAKEKLEEISELLYLREEEKRKALSTSIGGRETAMGDEELSRYYKLQIEKLSARTKEDGKKFLENILAFEKDYPKSPVRVNLDYEKVMAYELMGDHKGSVSLLEKIAKNEKSDFSDEAFDLLYNRHFCGLKAIERIKEERGRKVALYVLFGIEPKEGAIKSGAYSLAGAVRGIEGVSYNAAGFFGVGSFLRGLRYLRDKNIISVESYLDACSEYVRRQGPETPEIAMDMGKWLYRQNKFEDAEWSFKKVLEHNPDNNEAKKYIQKTNDAWQKSFYKAGENSLANGKEEEAFWNFSMLLRKFPDSKHANDTLFRAAEIYHRREDFENEKQVLNEILRRNPENNNVRKRAEERLEILK